MFNNDPSEFQKYVDNSTPVDSEAIEGTPNEIDLDARATLCPDGKVIDPTGEWETLDVWLDEQKSKNVRDIV